MEEEIDWGKVKKITYIVEVTENSRKTTRIDDWKDGHQTQSTILQGNDEIVFNS